MNQKISTETLNRVNAAVGIAGGALSIGLAVFQLVQLIRAHYAQKKSVTVTE